MAEIPGFLIAADAIVRCRVCGSEEGDPCVPVARDQGKPWREGQVHFGRRLARLLLTAKARLGERERLEAEAVEMFVEHLKTKRKAR